MGFEISVLSAGQEIGAWATVEGILLRPETHLPETHETSENLIHLNNSKPCISTTVKLKPRFLLLYILRGFSLPRPLEP